MIKFAVLGFLLLYTISYVGWRKFHTTKEDSYQFTVFNENRIIVDGPLMFIWYPLGIIDRCLTSQGYEMRDVRSSVKIMNPVK